jgi:integrase
MFPRAFPNRGGFTMKLTTANIELPEGKADAIFFDSELTGFGLRVRIGSGDRLMRNWIIQYRAHGHARRMVIADAAKVSAAEARKRARKLLAEVELDGDPAGDRRARREKDSCSLRSVINDFLDHKSGVKDRTLETLRRYLQGPLYIRSLQAMPIDKITRRDVSARLLAVSKESGAPTAIALRGALSSLFSWALQMGLCEFSPLIGAFTPAKPPARSRVLSDSELVEIWHGVEGDGDYESCIRLIICTACRREEIGNIRRGEFSDDGTSWTLPPSRSKNGKALVLPITPLMRSILDKVPQRDDNDHLFGRHGFTAWSIHKKALDEKLDLPPWVHHDLRRSVSTRMNDLNIAPPHIIEKILGHTIGGTHGIYNKAEHRAEIRNAMLRWSEHIHSLITGGEGKIVAFERAVASP